MSAPGTGRAPGGAFDGLHALAVKGMVGDGDLLATTGWTAAEVDAELARLVGDGDAVHLPRRGLWRLSDAGRERHAAELARRVPEAARARMGAPYREFLSVNRRLKALATRWQVRDGRPNDHTDGGYDTALVRELHDIHDTTAALAEEFATVDPRFARYAERLVGALTRLDVGDHTAFTGFGCESYHDVWMELHRDLQLCQQIDRQAEEAALEGAAR